MSEASPYSCQAAQLTQAKASRLIVAMRSADAAGLPAIRTTTIVATFPFDDIGDVSFGTTALAAAGERLLYSAANRGGGSGRVIALALASPGVSSSLIASQLDSSSALPKKRPKSQPVRRERSSITM